MRLWCDWRFSHVPCGRGYPFFLTALMCSRHGLCERMHFHSCSNSGCASFGSSPFAFSLLHLCCLATVFRWGSFQVLAPPHARLVGWSSRLGIGVRVNGMPASTGLQDRAHVAPRRYSHPNTSLCSPDGDSLVSALHPGFVKVNTFHLLSRRHVEDGSPFGPRYPQLTSEGGLLPSDGR